MPQANVWLVMMSIHRATRALRPFCLAVLQLLAALSLLACAGGCGLLARAPVEEPAQASAGLEGEWQGKPVPYKVRIRVHDGPEALAGQMKAASQLVQLTREPPDSLLALERRARADTASAASLLHSQGYYDGAASFEMDRDASPVSVVLTLSPGRRYNLGRADVYYDPAPVVPQFFRNRQREVGFWGLETEPVPPSFPSVLPGAAIGKPAVADDLLAAVNALPEALRRQGYPLAAVADTSYTLDREGGRLNADILVRPGPPALMGRIEVRGASEVSDEYVRRLAPWNTAEEPWNADMVEDYANTLRALGLFRTVAAKPLEDQLAAGAGRDGAAVLPLEVTVAEAPFRSVGASARYDTDTGLGVEGMWEHRNFFGNGEKLTLTAPVATETQGLKAAFEKPAFLAREQKLLASGSTLHEHTSAYEKMAGSGSGDVERRLSRQWWGSAGLGGESGSIKDNEQDPKGYGFFGPRVGLRRDTRNNVLNPSDGSELAVKLKPYTGFYGEAFNVMTGVVSASGYYAPFRKDGLPDDKLVLAGRVEAGGLAGAGLRTIPASLRYYTGGAGSVRGYAYQSLGPRDHKDEPLGGRSYQVVNLEARYKITDDFGIVPFLDGGMVYRDELPRVIGDMSWGTGLGFRYFTPIGPVRLDVGFPLQPIDGDPPVQIYVSIGQSF